MSSLTNSHHPGRIILRKLATPVFDTELLPAHVETSRMQFFLRPVGDQFFFGGDVHAVKTKSDTTLLRPHRLGENEEFDAWSLQCSMSGGTPEEQAEFREGAAILQFGTREGHMLPPWAVVPLANAVDDGYRIPPEIAITIRCLDHEGKPAPYKAEEVSRQVKEISAKISEAIGLIRGHDLRVDGKPVVIKGDMLFGFIEWPCPFSVKDGAQVSFILNGYYYKPVL